MMTHIEGPIVDSFYDMSLCSWHNELKPPLPSYNSPAALGGLPSFEQQSHSQMFAGDGSPKDHSRSGNNVQHGSAIRGTSVLADGNQIGYEGQDTTSGGESREFPQVVEDASKQMLPEHTEKDPHYDPDIASEVTRAVSVLVPRGSESKMNAVTRHLSTPNIMTSINDLILIRE